MESHLERKVLHFNLTQAIEIIHCLSPNFKHKSTVEPQRRLSYTWNFAHDDPAFDLESIVTFTLVPTKGGTLLRMEQSGFRPDQKQAFGGAAAGWREFFARLEDVMARID
ncbi:MAG: SRPBCC domain-containing protein [Flavobacteriaceae bacterium]